MAMPQGHIFFEGNKIKENNYFIKSSYTARSKPEYFTDNIKGAVYQPDVYTLAKYLASRFKCEYIVDIGCGQGGKLNALHPHFKIVGIDYGDNLAVCRERYPFGTWVEFDLDMPFYFDKLEGILGKALLICSDVIEHLINPEYLLVNIEMLMKIAPLCIISTPERDLTRGFNDNGPPANPSHVREWNSSEFKKMIDYFDVNMKFLGLTVGNNLSHKQETIIGIIINNEGLAKEISLTDFNDFKGSGTTLKLC